MFFSIWEKVFTRNIGNVRSRFLSCPYPVRRNASSIWPTYRFFSSETGHCNQTDVEGRNAEGVKQVLRDYGFNDTHISEVARLCSPYGLNAEKNILPKLKFYNSIGISNTDMPKFVLRGPFLLTSSLEKQIIPCYKYLKNMPFGDENIIQMLKCRPGILLTRVKDVLAPNFELLIGMGLPVSSMTFLLLRCNSTLCRNHEKFKSFVDLAIEMGINPMSKAFILAVHVLCSLSTEAWEHKLKLYKSFGLSDGDILSAFRKQPMIMAASEKKILKTLNFFLKEMSFSPDVVVRSPLLILLNLEMRSIPRCHVMEKLIKRGLVKKISPWSYLKLTEVQFLNKYLYKHKVVMPELMDIYNLSRLSQSKTDNTVHLGQQLDGLEY